MSFLKSSVSHEYLYSPNSWLHRKRTHPKILFTWIQSVFLPLITVKYMLAYLLIFIFCIFSHLPKRLKKYLYKITIIFVFFIIFSIQENHIINKDIARKQIVIPINTFSNLCNKLNQENFININKLETLNIYIPASIVRLLSLSFIYLLSTKILILTTKHEKIISFIIKHKRNTAEHIGGQLNFETIISTQFLQIVLQEIEAINTAYIIRNARNRKRYLHKDNLFLLCLLTKHFLLKIYQYTYHISRTLYGRNVGLKLDQTLSNKHMTS